jgi:hypothetical protein
MYQIVDWMDPRHEMTRLENTNLLPFSGIVHDFWSTITYSIHYTYYTVPVPFM